MFHRSIVALTGSVVLAAADRGSAQNLDLLVDGGSMPGQITWDLGPGQPFVQAGVIILSVTPGPTPLLLLNPLDTRSLCVGTELFSLAQSGVFQANGRFSPAPLPVPDIPAAYDAPLFLQGVSVPGTPFVVDQISDVRAVRFAPAGQWRDRVVALGTPRSFFPLADLPGGETMALGGGQGAIFAQIAQRSTEIYSPKLDRYRFGPDMNFERSLHTSTRLADGRYLIVGGVDVLNDPQVTAEIFDPVAMTFTQVASMSERRMGHAAVLLPDGRVLISGGIRDLNQPNSPIDPIFQTVKSTEIYDPRSNAWVRGPDMTEERVGHSAVVLPNGKVMLAGGVGFFFFIFNIPTIERTVDIYDPAGGPNGSISAGPMMTQARAVYSHIWVAPDRLLLAGGVGTISLTQWGALTDKAEIYDATSNTFAPTAPMQQRRGLHVAIDLGGGRFAHIGGADGTLFATVPLASVEVWDRATGRWSPGSPMTRSRAAFGAFETATGQIHAIAGEVGQTGVDNSTEWFYR